MVSSDEINRRLEAKRRGVKYQEAGRNDRNFRAGGVAGNSRECPYCQTQNPSTAKFCVGCGRRLETPEPEMEKVFTPEIKGPETGSDDKTETIKEPVKSGAQISRRPDDFGGSSNQRIQSSQPKSEKLEPIVPPEPETIPEVEVKKTPKVPEPPQVKRPETILTPEPQVQKPETDQKHKSDVDPVERIKKAKELLDLGAITQEEYDIIKNKYLDEI